MIEALCDWSSAICSRCSSGTGCRDCEAINPYYDFSVSKEMGLNPPSHIKPITFGNELRTYDMIPIVHSKKTDPWGVFDFFQMFWKIFQFLFSSVLKLFLSFYHFNFKCVLLGKATFPLSRENQRFCLFTHKQTFRCRCASYMYQSYQRRAKASRRWLCTATALVRCREDDSKNPRCAGFKGNS